MLNKIENYYLKQEEANRGFLLALRGLVLDFDPIRISQEWKYGLPFFYYKKKPFCYFWKDKKTQEPYIGMAKGYLIEHPSLESGDRTRIKILPLNTSKDIDIRTLYEVFELAIQHYK